MNIKQENDSFSIKGKTWEKFLAISGIAAQAAVITREQYNPDNTTLTFIAGLGFAYVGAILGRHLNPKQNIKKAAFLTVGGGALLAAGIITDFSGDNLKDTLLAIPAIITVAGFSTLVDKLNTKEEYKKPKI